MTSPLSIWHCEASRIKQHCRAAWPALWVALASVFSYSVVTRLLWTFAICPHFNTNSFPIPFWKKSSWLYLETPLEPQNPPNFLSASTDHFTSAHNLAILPPPLHLQRMRWLLRHWPSTSVLYLILWSPWRSASLSYILSILGLGSQLPK